LSRKEELEKVDHIDLLNRKVDFINEKLKQVYIKMDRLFENKKESNSNANNVFSLQSAYSVQQQANPFSYSSIYNQDKLETPRTRIIEQHDSNLTSVGEVLSLEKINIKNETKKAPLNENEFLKNFNKSQNETRPPAHTSKSILLNPKSDPDILSK
jgi:hypothetical protein